MGPEYGNWVSKKIIYTPGVAGIVFLGLGLLLPLFLIPAGLLFACAAYFAYARHLFAAQRGNVQDHIFELVPVARSSSLNPLDPSNRCLKSPDPIYRFNDRAETVSVPRSP